MDVYGNAAADAEDKGLQAQDKGLQAQARKAAASILARLGAEGWFESGAGAGAGAGIGAATGVGAGAGAGAGTGDGARGAATGVGAGAGAGEASETARTAGGGLPDAMTACAVALGSGLGGFTDRLSARVEIPYKEIPGFPISTAPGHKGAIAFGTLDGKTRVACMQGRFHLYEGYSAQEAVFYIRVLWELGVRRLILTNAAGGIDESWRPGDLMLINDHINLMGRNPLVGPNAAAYGPRFPDMSDVYSSRLRALARRVAREAGIGLREGVYVGVLGPCYETPAEIRAFRVLGAHAVGMSTVPEAIAAKHCGMEVLGISCITNMASGILEQPLNEQEVIETASRSSAAFGKLLERILAETGERR